MTVATAAAAVASAASGRGRGGVVTAVAAAAAVAAVIAVAATAEVAMWEGGVCGRQYAPLSPAPRPPPVLPQREPRRRPGNRRRLVRDNGLGQRGAALPTRRRRRWRGGPPRASLSVGRWSRADSPLAKAGVWRVGVGGERRAMSGAGQRLHRCSFGGQPGCWERWGGAALWRSCGWRGAPPVGFAATSHPCALCLHAYLGRVAQRGGLL